MRSAARHFYFNICASLFYNPYSIVNETLVAKTNAGGNLVDCFHRLFSRVSRRCGNSNNQKGVNGYFGSSVPREAGG
jgi:hypothetical protein